MDLLPEFPDLMPPGVSAALSSLPKPTHEEVENLLAAAAIPSALPTREELYALTVQEKNKKVELARLYAREHFTKRMTDVARLGCEIVVLRLPDEFDKKSFVQAFDEDGYSAGIDYVSAAWLTRYDANPLEEQEAAQCAHINYRTHETAINDAVAVLIVDLRPRPTIKEQDNFRYLGRPSWWTRLREFFCCVPKRPGVCEMAAMPVEPFRVRRFHH